MTLTHLNTETKQTTEHPDHTTNTHIRTHFNFPIPWRNQSPSPTQSLTPPLTHTPEMEILQGNPTPPPTQPQTPPLTHTPLIEPTRGNHTSSCARPLILFVHCNDLKNNLAHPSHA